MPEGVAFVDSNLQRMSELMLSQDPEKLSLNECGMINKSLDLVVNILLEVSPEDLYKKYLDTVTTLFNDNLVYYCGSRQVWASSSYSSKGHPEVREKLLQKFSSSGGFERLCVYSASSSPENECLLWNRGENADKLARLLQGLTCVKDEVNVKFAFIEEVIRGLVTITDAQLKNTTLLEAVNDILESLTEVAHYDVDISSDQFRLVRLFHPFWLKFVDKMLSVDSVVVKLMAWDQLNSLIVAAHISKPRAAQYLVSGAGAPGVDGLYSFSRYNKTDQSVVYTKLPAPASSSGQPSTSTNAAPSPPGDEAGRAQAGEDGGALPPAPPVPADEEEPLLTLFRCKMQNQSRWWFISDADLHSPGTDRDIDYYHRVLDKDKTGGIDLEMTGPPLTKWVKASSAGSRGVAPAPSLSPCGLIMNEGMQESDFLVHKLKRFIIEKDMVAQVFGSSMHREVVSRSLKMLFFLAENDCVTSEHLRMIWISALSRACDADTAEEVLSALVRLCEKLPEHLVSTMMVIAVDMASSWRKDRNKDKDIDKETDKPTSSITANTNSASLDSHDVNQQQQQQQQQQQHQQEQQILAQSQLSKIVMMLSKIESSKLALFDKRSSGSSVIDDSTNAGDSAGNAQADSKGKEESVGEGGLVLDLAWAVLTSPHWHGLRPAEQEVVHVFLKQGLLCATPPAIGSRGANNGGALKGKILECLDTLMSFASGTRRKSRGSSKKADETMAVRALEILTLLLSLCHENAPLATLSLAHTRPKTGAAHVDRTRTPGAAGAGAGSDDPRANVATALHERDIGACLVQVIRSFCRVHSHSKSSKQASTSKTKAYSSSAGSSSTSAGAGAAASGESQNYYFRVSLCIGALLSVYSLSSDVNVARQHLDDLWSTLGEAGDAQEIELFFDFLSKGVGIGVSDVSGATSNVAQYDSMYDTRQIAGGGSASAFDIPVHGIVATEERAGLLMCYLCKPTLRWDLCGSKALHCLRLCWQLLQTDSDRVQLLESTWKAALDMSDRAFGTEGRNQDSIGWTASAGNPSPKLGSGNVKVACDLLLKAHADLASSRCPTDTDYASSPTPTLLTRALDALNRVFNEAHSSITYETATDSAPTPAKEAIPSFSTTNTRHASRIIDLLVAATRERATGENPSDSFNGSIAFDSVPHGVRGTLGNFQTKVIFRDLRKRRVTIDRQAVSASNHAGGTRRGEPLAPLYPPNSLGAAVGADSYALGGTLNPEDDFGDEVDQVGTHKSTGRNPPAASQPVTMQLSMHPLHTFTQLATMALATSVYTRIPDFGRGDDSSLSQRDANKIVINSCTDRLTVILGGRTVPQDNLEHHLFQWGIEEGTTVSIVLNDLISNVHASAIERSYYGPYSSMGGDSTGVSIMDDNDIGQGGFDYGKQGSGMREQLSCEGGSQSTNDVADDQVSHSTAHIDVDVGTALAASIDQFASLMRLCDAATAASGTVGLDKTVNGKESQTKTSDVADLVELKDKLWHLLQVIPTQEQMENRISLVEEPDWATLLAHTGSPSSSPSMLVYTLEVVDHALSPAVARLLGSAAAERESERERRRLAFRKKFVVTGGLQRVLDLLCSDSNHREHTDHIGSAAPLLPGRAVAVILHLLRRLLSHSSGASPDADIQVKCNASKPVEDDVPGSPIRSFPSLQIYEQTAHSGGNSAPTNDEPAYVEGIKDVIFAQGPRIIAVLVELAVEAASAGNHVRLADGFVIINKLLSLSPVLTAELTRHSLCVQLIKTTLLSDSRKVRQAGLLFSKQLGAVSFAFSPGGGGGTSVEASATTRASESEAGRMQCLGWLLDSLVEANDQKANGTPESEIYAAVAFAVSSLAGNGADLSDAKAHLQRLATLILAALRNYPDAKTASLAEKEHKNGRSKSSRALLGYLTLADTLLSVVSCTGFPKEIVGQADREDTVSSTMCALAPLLINNFVLPLPPEALDSSSASCTPSAASAATQVSHSPLSACSMDEGEGSGLSSVSSSVSNAAMRVLLKLQICMNIGEIVSKAVHDAISPHAYTDVALSHWSRAPVGSGDSSQGWRLWRDRDSDGVAADGAEVDSDGEISVEYEDEDEDKDEDRDRGVPRAPIGLKNQGCTCYMNSLLQQLFLCKSFRIKILNAELPERYRTSIWHRLGEGLVGCTVVIRQNSNAHSTTSTTATKKQQFIARVIGFDSVTQKYDLEFGEKRHHTRLDLRTRMNSCTVIGANGDDASIDALSTEPDEAEQTRIDAYLVLSELQRCFCYMLWSDYTYYDPKPLVDACQCLRMEYTVYQQVSEVCLLSPSR